MKLLEVRKLRRSGIQLASGGHWENAFQIDFANREAIARWLSSADSDVAIEVIFFDQSETLAGFIGFRRIIEIADERVAFWQDILESLKDLGSEGPDVHLRACLMQLGHPPLLATSADGIELGVFNQWRSAGSIRLGSNRLTLQEREDGPDWIRRGATATICREYFWNSPEQIWIADAVSHLDSGRHILNAELLPH